MRSLARSQGTFTRWLFGVSLLVTLAATGIARALISLGHAGDPNRAIGLPVAFWGTSILLLFGSVFLHRAVEFVRIEKQSRFRKSMLAALTTGTMFVGVQSFGIWCLLNYQQPEDAETSAATFVLVFVVLHALHFSVALMFLVFVTLKGLADRYDHESYWGVTVCAWFWHVLGIAWIAILAVLVIANVDESTMQRRQVATQCRDDRHEAPTNESCPAGPQLPVTC
ncbi:MAG: hypothetical protein O3A00_11480 [Planctomycetota bacterium]|nr:hypothetical protein [Planctomycetota bacterium]